VNDDRLLLCDEGTSRELYGGGGESGLDSIEEERSRDCLLLLLLDFDFIFDANISAARSEKEDRAFRVRCCCCCCCCCVVVDWDAWKAQAEDRLADCMMEVDTTKRL
jgi:streptolysin S family bacteriocin protoxin